MLFKLYNLKAHLNVLKQQVGKRQEDDKMN